MKCVQSKRSIDAKAVGGRFADATSYAAEMLDAPLGCIGLRRENGDARAGALYRGDGVISSGWYWAWSRGQGLIIAACDFTLLESASFEMDVDRYFAVRHESFGLLPCASVWAFMETRPGPRSIMLPKGMRFSYSEVEYFDGYCQEMFGCDFEQALAPCASCLSGLKGSDFWDQDIEAMLLAIHPDLALDMSGALELSSLADGLMSKLLAMQKRVEGGVSAQDRHAIFECVEFIRSELGSTIRQKDLLDVARMGATKFKRLFKHYTGMTVTDFVASERIARAKSLLSTTDQSIEEVAHACGFKRATSFSTLFSRLVGVSPGKWRTGALVSFGSDPERAVRKALKEKGFAPVQP